MSAEKYNVDQLVETIVKKYKQKFLTGKGMITLSTIVQVTAHLMQLVETITKLNGFEKKQLVLQALRVLIEEIADEKDPNESQEKIILERVLEALLPTVIDQLIVVERGQLKFNKKCGNCLFSCCQ